MIAMIRLLPVEIAIIVAVVVYVLLEKVIVKCRHG